MEHRFCRISQIAGQQPHIPLMIGGTGAKVTLKLAALEEAGVQKLRLIFYEAA